MNHQGAAVQSTVVSHTRMELLPSLKGRASIRAEFCQQKHRLIIGNNNNDLLAGRMQRQITDSYPASVWLAHQSSKIVFSRQLNQTNSKLAWMVLIIKCATTHVAQLVGCSVSCSIKLTVDLGPATLLAQLFFFFLVT